MPRREDHNRLLVDIELCVTCLDCDFRNRVNASLQTARRIAINHMRECNHNAVLTRIVDEHYRLNDGD